MARNRIAMTARSGPMVRRLSHGQQLTLRLPGHWRAFQLLRPRIDQPCSIRVRSIGGEEETEIASVACIRSHARRNSACLPLVLKLAWIDPHRIVKMLKKTSRHRLKPHRRSLARDQALSVHVEFVALGLSTKNRMVFKHQARSLRALRTLAKQCRRKTADAATHDYAVKGFAGVLDGPRTTVEGVITNRVAVSHHLMRVAVRVGIVANARSAVPLIGSHKLKWACGNQRGSGSQQGSVQKVTTRHPLRL